LDQGRLAAARARLDAIAYGTGDTSTAQRALAGLAAAAGIPPLIYRGLRGSAARRQIASTARPDAGMAQDASAQASATPDTATTRSCRRGDQRRIRGCDPRGHRCSGERIGQCRHPGRNISGSDAAHQAGHHAGHEGDHGGGHH
jgi:hypothetical protein